MNLIKNIFLISLINFGLLIVIVLYFSGRTSAPLPVMPQVPVLTPSPASAIITTTPTLKSTPVPTARPTPTPNPQAGRCIIIIDGIKYDVTNFRNIHSGGDVFTCGADLSQLFHDRHSNRFLDIMVQFKI